MNITRDNYKNFTYFILLLIFVSTAISYGLSKFVESYNINVPFYISIPSITGIYAGLFSLFEKYFWKLSLFKKLGIVCGDNLNGKWMGTLKSSYDNFETEYPAQLEIRQSATKIKIYGIFNKSKSVSIHENFGKNEVDGKVALYYFYRNEPNYDAVQSMAVHEGSVKLFYDDKNNILEGYYYSGRDRNNYGTIKIKKM